MLVHVDSDVEVYIIAKFYVSSIGSVFSILFSFPLVNDESHSCPKRKTAVKKNVSINRFYFWLLQKYCLKLIRFIDLFPK